MMETTRSMSKEEERKSIAKEYFDLVKSGRFKEGLRFFSPDCKTHNPYISGDMSTLTEAMIEADKEGTAQFPNAEFVVRHIIADGDMVAVHTDLLSDRSKPNEGGLRQAHLLRFEGDKIVEYWDITQQMLPDMPNAGGAF
jgi:predicted SnoaL-like aldol condensation-catalyzing enzyme